MHLQNVIMEPKYIELTRTLIKEIGDGIYPVDSLLPGEIELATQHQVSRSTVRAALLRLQELGLISRKKKMGTRVEKNRPQDIEYSPHMSTLDELFEYHLKTRRTISKLHEIVVDIELSQVLACQPGERWLQCLVTRTLNDAQKTPLSYSQVYVRANLVKSLHKQLIKTQSLINEFIAKQTGVTAKEIRQTISAVAINATHAHFFNIEEGTPALEIKRQHYDEGDKVYHVGLSVLPADRFVYETLLTRRTLNQN